MISVIVPTYRRTDGLQRCLIALHAQRLLPQEVLVIVRSTDSETNAFLERNGAMFPLARKVPVHEPGQVAALNAGLAECAGSIVAFTDDDAVPRPQWLQRAAEHLRARPDIGGVGGRDHVHWRGTTVEGEAAIVGRIQWSGRLRGNHHLGSGAPREVHFLKGANMIYRRTAIGSILFDRRLKGSGAQVHNDLAFALQIRRQGWKLLYDPEVAVDHFPAERVDDLERAVTSTRAAREMGYNEARAFLLGLGVAQRFCCLFWSTLVGSVDTPGVLRLVRQFLHRDFASWQRFQAAHVARLEALFERNVFTENARLE